jgi:predicted DCC family thiol-disulfide oxidoreductase YuxK
MSDHPLIYYDGYCNLCSRVVQWVVRNDRKKHFRFRPLEAKEEETVILEAGGKRYERSSAAIRIAMGLRFPWPVLGILLACPRFLRDPVYRWVARNRTRWFGRRQDCFLPPGDFRTFEK